LKGGKIMETLAKVIEIIAQTMNLKVEDIKAESKLVDLNIDELDSVEIIMECENIFNISILDEDAEKFVTVGDMVANIEKLLTPESGEGK
jgi:acyl carrier protein